MKGTALAFISLIVGTLAGPALPTVVLGDVMTPNASNEQRIVTGQIIKAIEDAAQGIRDAGLDPYKFEGSYDYKLPVPVLFAANAIVEGLYFTGLSNIAVNSMNYSILTNRLTFNISLPRLSLIIGNSGFDTVFFGDKFEGSLSGSLDIIQLRIIGNIRINVGIISGISIRSISLQFSLGNIESRLNLKLFAVELSQRVNTYLGTTLPTKLNEFAKEINDLIELIAWNFINNESK